MRAVNAVRRLLGATVGRLARIVLSGLIIGYRRLLSPLLGPRCRFYPSCSTYALEAISVHGAAKGTVLATARVCRCHPWNPGGVDHVPVKGAWKPEPYVSLEHVSLEHGSPESAPPASSESRPDSARTTEGRSAA